MKNIAFTLLCVASSLLIFSCKKKVDAAPQLSKLAVVTIKKENATMFSSYSTTLEGERVAEIRPKITAFIKKVHVDEGSVVRRGQLLFTLETNAISQDLEAKKAQVRSAQVEVDRLKPLVAKGIVSAVQLESAQASLDAALSDYNSEKATVGYASIYSPMDGIVGGIPFKEGNLVSPTMPSPITSVANTQNIYAYFSMSEAEYLTFLKKNKNINALKVSLLLPDGSTYGHEGKIQTVNGLTNSATGSIEFRAIFPNPEKLLRSGGSGTIQVPQTQNAVVVLPKTAVVEIQDKMLVYVLDSANKVHSKIVNVTGAVNNDYILNGGINEGDKVVTEDVYKLKEDQEIVPVTK